MDVHKKECFYPVTTVNCLQSKSVLWLHWEATSFIVRSVISPTSQTEKTQIKSIHVHDPKEKTNHLFAHNGGILRLKLYPSVQ